MTEVTQSHENRFTGIIRPLVESDIELLRPVLAHWLKDRQTQQPLPEEVQEDMDAMRGSLDGTNNRVYLVAQTTGGNVIGMIGYRKPEGKMLSWQEENIPGINPAELINAYVSPDFTREKGVGRALVAELEKRVKQAGFTDIILNSGPRYEESGWGFYDKLQPQGFHRVDIIEKMYGEGGDAPVWRKVLIPQT